MLLCGAKVMEISSMTIIVCFPQTAPPHIQQCTCRRNYPGRICSGEKKEICTAYKYPSKVLAGEGAREMN